MVPGLTLIDLCKIKIVQTITDEHLRMTLDLLTDQQNYTLSSILPLNLSYNVSLTQNLHPVYWKRKCAENSVPLVSFWLCNCNWRDTFITHSVETILASFISKTAAASEIELMLRPFYNHLFTLKVNGFKYNYFKNDEIISDSTSETVGSLIKLISNFKNVEELYLYNFPFDYQLPPIEDMNVGGKQHEEFAQMIISNKQLKQLTLIGTQLNITTLPLLVNGLIQIDKIHHLNLSCNLITDDFCEEISEVFKLPSMETLLLTNNKISNTGVKSIASALCKNNTLLTLCLDRNLVGDEGGIVLCQSLKFNAVFSKLNVSYNRISSESTSELCTLIKESKSLQHLDISGNFFGKESGEEIYEAVRRSKTLSFLGFQFCGFSKETEDKIHVHFSQNHVMDYKYSCVKLSEKSPYFNFKKY